MAGPYVFAVADGMGGHAAGEIASAITVAELASMPALDDDPEPADTVRAALEDINAEIARRSTLDPTTRGMGTTVTGIARAGAGRVVVFNVGDSRVYRLRGGALQQMTEDHSLVADLVRNGQITAEEARTHPDRNVISQALGLHDDIDADVRVEPLAVGDCYLVASDGLFNEVDDRDIVTMLAGIGPVEARTRALLDAALNSGGRDNISVVVVQAVSTDTTLGLESDTSPSVPDETDEADGPTRTSAGGVRPLITSVPGAETLQG